MRGGVHTGVCGLGRVGWKWVRRHCAPPALTPSSLAWALCTWVGRIQHHHSGRTRLLSFTSVCGRCYQTRPCCLYRRKNGLGNGLTCHYFCMGGLREGTRGFKPPFIKLYLYTIVLYVCLVRDQSTHTPGPPHPTHHGPRFLFFTLRCAVVAIKPAGGLI